jgi:hypothetical protein
MSEEKKRAIPVTDPVLTNIGKTKIPVTYPDPVNVKTSPLNMTKARSNTPQSEVKVKNK